MSLPIKAAPTFRCKLPGLNKEVKYHPYTVDEEKILLIALEGGNEKELADATKQVVANCLVDADLKIEDLSLSDFEFLMLKIRAKSAEDKIHVKFKGRPVECEHCKKDKIIEINLDEVEVHKFPEHKNKIMLRDDLGLIMHEPTVKESSKFQIGTKASEKLDVLIELTVECLDTIFDGEKTYSAKDYTREDLLAFVRGLTRKQIDLIEQFFDTLPVLRKQLDLSCEHCGYKEFYTLQRLSDFFD